MMADDQNELRSIPLDASVLKTIFDWSVRLVPVLWIVFQFYAHQDELTKNTTKADGRITELQTQLNELRRDLTANASDVRALKQQLEDEKEFYRETRHR